MELNALPVTLFTMKIVNHLIIFGSLHYARHYFQEAHALMKVTENKL